MAEYIFPKHWQIKKLGEVCEKISLNGIKIKQKDYLENGKFPVVDQGQAIIGGYSNEEKLIVPGEPPYIIFGDHTKVKKFINFKFIAGADGVKVLKPYSIFDPKFFFYLIQTSKIPDKGYARHFQFLEKVELPIPPLNEQLTIVSKIEELLSDLENGKQQLQRAQQQLKIYRQGLLKWAFEGRFGYAQRPSSDVKNGELPKAWKFVTLKSLSHIISDGDHQAPPKASLGIPFITISNVNKSNNKIDFSNTFKVDLAYYQNLKPNRKPLRGDVLYTVTGSFGIPILIDFDKEFCFQRHIGLVRPLETVNKKWIFYVLQSPQVFDQARKTATGTAQKTVSLNSLRNFSIPFCSFEEQQYIVEELESKLTVCDKIEETINQSLQQAETLRQSILKKAFEGKLI